MKLRMLTIIAMTAGMMACGAETEEQTATPQQTASISGSPLNLGGITLTSPDVWQSQPPSSSMRKAQFVLPKQGGDAADGELVVFYFGRGNAGTVEANLARWRGQMKGAQGETTKRSVNGMSVTTLDVSGSYAAASGPMMQAGPAQPGYRMIASIVESPAGAYYFKLTGPASTVGHWKPTFDGFIGSAKAS